MACAEYPSFWRRAGRAALSNPRSMVLALFGLACFAAGIIWGNNIGGTGLIVVGSGILCLGVLLPVVQEAQIGTEGFSFKKAMQERDDDFRPFVESQHDTLQRLTVMLTGDARAAEACVNDALAQAYGEWSFVPTRHRGFYLVCSAVRRALGALKVGLAVPTAGELPAGVRPLLALRADARAAALLHHYQGLGGTEIARILEFDDARVAELLDEVATKLQAGAGPATEPVIELPADETMTLEEPE